MQTSEQRRSAALLDDLRRRFEQTGRANATTAWRNALATETRVQSMQFVAI
ncbi:hypothetical protein FHT02_003287 [Sphingomonas xinjiangensis]|uniref:Uncharacterized protein n=1 Tax=Sphingomonas xinjiangensis TaxID=643568 RepID=A0A840YR84_9SPHN|nr:hypothetical protein [Sphingomonas xinjiangensis]